MANAKVMPFFRNMLQRAKFAISNHDPSKSHVKRCQISSSSSDEVELQKSQLMLQWVIESIEVGVIVFSQKGLPLKWNHAAKQLLGMSDSELVSTDIIQIFVTGLSENNQTFLQDQRLLVQRLLAGTPCRDIAIVTRASVPQTGQNQAAEFRWLNLSAEPFPRGIGDRPECIVTFFQAYAGQHNKESGISQILAHLAASEASDFHDPEFLKAFFEGAPDAIIAVNEQRKLVFGNKRFSELFVLESGEFDGRLTDALYAQHAGWRKVGNIIQDDHSINVFPAEYLEFKRKDGSVFIGHINGIRLPSLATEKIENAVRYIAVIRDFAAEQGLERFRDRAMRLSAFAQLAGSISHDVNNFLTVASTNLQLLSSVVTSTSQRQSIQVAHTALTQGAKLNQMLLSFLSRDRLDVVCVNINAIFSETQGVLQSALGNNIQISSSLASDLRRTHIVSGGMENALLNLFLNARDAMPNGGVVEARTRNVTVATSDSLPLSGVAPGEYVSLSVRDSGVGMSTTTMAKAFEPFFTTKIGGTGLGLAGVHHFVKQSGGAVTIESKVDRGTNITIYLPAIQETPHSDFEFRPQLNSDTKDGLTILVVGEHADAITAKYNRLLDEGIILSAVADANAIVDRLRVEPSYTIVLCDADISGYAVAQAVADAVWREFSETSVVITSHAVLVEEFDLKPNAVFVRKPFTTSDIALAFSLAPGRKNPPSERLN
jgi:PAS domain S-box-containing protein